MRILLVFLLSLLLLQGAVVPSNDDGNEGKKPSGRGDRGGHSYPISS